MTAPTTRQQAGYLRRLLRRGEVQICDPNTGRPIQALVEIDGDKVRLTPVPSRYSAQPEAEPTEPRWSDLMKRLRSKLSIEEAEELLQAVEAEQRTASLLESFGK